MYGLIPPCLVSNGLQKSLKQSGLGHLNGLQRLLKAFEGGSLIRSLNKEVLRTVFKPTKTFLKLVLELLLDVLEMLLDVLDLSCRPWTCPGMARRATIVPS